MLQSFFIPFLTILVAEMLDKSQLAILTLSGRTKSHLSLFLGSMLAFVIVDGLAIVFGSTISKLFPQSLVSVLAGVLFIIFGILSFREIKDEKVKTFKKGGIFATSFLLVFVSEWADKTQLAAAALSTYLNPFLVFLGTISALSLIVLLAIFVGVKLAEKINKALLRKITGIIFLLIGVLFLYSAL